MPRLPTKQVQNRYSKFEETQISVRLERRQTWTHVTLLSSAVLGFSASLLKDTEGVGAIFSGIGWVLLIFSVMWGVVLLSRNSTEYLIESATRVLRDWDTARINKRFETRVSLKNALLGMLPILYDTADKDKYLKTRKKFLSELTDEDFRDFVNTENPLHAIVIGAPGFQRWRRRQYDRIFTERIFLFLFASGVVCYSTGLLIDAGFLGKSSVN